MSERTAFMIARASFHAARTPDVAKAYADAALVATDFGPSMRDAVANELDHAGFADEATRVRPTA